MSVFVWFAFGAFVEVEAELMDFSIESALRNVELFGCLLLVASVAPEGCGHGVAFRLLKGRDGHDILNAGRLRHRGLILDKRLRGGVAAATVGGEGSALSTFAFSSASSCLRA